MTTACVRPCRACPWRVDTHTSAIDGFILELAESLAETSPQNGYGPEFGATLFACHESAPGQELACAGWLATQGHAHPSVRIMVMTGRLDGSALEPKEGWPELHQTFEEMIAQLREQNEV